MATIHHRKVGFLSRHPTGHIDCLYVHHQFQSQGVGSALLNAAIQEAKKQGLKTKQAEVSLTAEPFFKHHGF